MRFFTPRLTSWWWISSAVVLWTALSWKSQAADAPQVANNLAQTPGPYCGLHCVYAAAKTYGRNPRFEDLLKTQYLGSAEGSSPAELLSALESLDLCGVALGGMMSDDLYRIKHPTLLLLSRPQQEGTLRHWVLATKADQGKFHIMEAPGRIQIVTAAELLAQWKGLGIVVLPDSTSAQSFAASFGFWRWATALMVTCSLAALALALSMGKQVDYGFVRRYFPRPESRFRHAALLGIAGCVLSLGWHAVAPAGFLSNGSTVAYVKANHFIPHLKTVTKQEVVAALGQDQSLVMIDARLPRTFAHGHLRGAVNVPVFATQTELREFVEKLPADARVVVYCQSEACPYDEMIAQRLHWMGINNLAIYPGGWRDFEGMHGKTD